MKTLRLKAWALVKADGHVAWDLGGSIPQPIVTTSRAVAMAMRSIDTERVVRVNLTITADKRAAKRGHK